MKLISVKKEKNFNSIMDVYYADGFKNVHDVMKIFEAMEAADVKITTIRFEEDHDMYDENYYTAICSSMEQTYKHLPDILSNNVDRISASGLCGDQRITCSVHLAETNSVVFYTEGPEKDLDCVVEKVGRSF